MSEFEDLDSNAWTCPECFHESPMRALQIFEEARKGYVKLEDVIKVISIEKDDYDRQWFCSSCLDNILEKIKELDKQFGLEE